MRNGLKRHRIAVAGPLLLGAVVMSSCLIPQPDDPLPVFPPTENHRPRIILGRIHPTEPNGTTVYEGPCSAEPPFTVYVEDEDLGDTLQANWFATSLDGMTKTGVINIATTDIPMPKPATTPQRPFAFLPPVDFFNHAPFNSIGDRRIDVTVTDGQFITHNGIDLEELPVNQYPLDDGGFQDEPAGTDSFTWTVNVKQCPMP